MKSIRPAIIAILLPLSACASQPPPVPDAPGFLTGLFHGLVALIALLGSLFLKVKVYAWPNAGFGYELGFCLGFAVSLLAIILPLLARVGGWLTRN